MKKLTLLLIIAFFATALNSPAQILNKKLQSMSLKDLNGKTVDLLNYTDSTKITVICIWATYCPPCLKQVTNINNLLDEWMENYHMKFIAISVNDARTVKNVKPFVKGKGWTFDVLLDPNADTKRTFNFVMEPYCLLIDKDGTIVYTHLGYVEGDELLLEKEIQKIVKK